MTRMATINRKAALAACFVAATIHVDGRPAGVVRNGQTLTAAIDEGAHELGVTMESSAPARAFIAAGQGDVAFGLAAKMGRPKFRMELQQLGAPAATAPQNAAPRNELDDYREGGARRTPRIKGEGELTIDVAEAWMISGALGNFFSGMLAPDFPPIVEYARSVGARPRAAVLAFSLREGACKYGCTFYASPTCAPESKIITFPNDDSFDYLISDKEHERRCMCPSHDLMYIRDLLLTDVAQERPEARLNGNVLTVVYG